MRLSIIIPAYNASAYIERCLESVLDQDIDDYEVIVIDDGSSDDTLALLQNFKGGGSKRHIINVLTQENRGVSATRNRGIDIAQGDYVMFVDADDVVQKNTLGDIFSLVSEQEDAPDLVVSGIKSITRGNVESSAVTFPLDWTADVKTFFYKLDISSVLCTPCGKLYKRDLLLTHGVRFPIGIKFYEDGLFNLYFARYCRSVMSVPVVSYSYIKNDGSATSRFYGEDLIGYYEAIRNARIDYFCRGDKSADVIDWINRVSAFDYLFGIYALYRSKNGCPDKKKWMKRYWSAAGEHDPEWSYQLDSGIPKITGIIGRRSKFLLDLWLRMIFSAEKLKKSFRK